MPFRNNQISHQIHFDRKSDKETLQSLLWELKNIMGCNFGEIVITALYYYLKHIKNELKSNRRAI